MTRQPNGLQRIDSSIAVTTPGNTNGRRRQATKRDRCKAAVLNKVGPDPIPVPPWRPSGRQHFSQGKHARNLSRRLAPQHPLFTAPPAQPCLPRHFTPTPLLRCAAGPGIETAHHLLGLLLPAPDFSRSAPRPDDCNPRPALKAGVSALLRIVVRFVPANRYPTQQTIVRVIVACGVMLHSAVIPKSN